MHHFMNTQQTLDIYNLKCFPAVDHKYSVVDDVVLSHKYLPCLLKNNDLIICRTLCKVNSTSTCTYICIN